RQEMAECYRNLGWMLRKAGWPEKAEAAFRKALPIQKELADDFPQRPDLRAELAQTHYRLGQVLLSRSQEGAKSAWRDALPILQKLVADCPTVPGYHNALAETLGNLACLYLERQDLAAGVKLLEQARPHHQAALKANGTDATYRQSYHTY